MRTPEFKVLIDGEAVTGWYGRPGHEYDQVAQANLELDPLTLDTAVLMNRWLSLWDLIDSSELRKKESLLQPSTLKVLGTQLWRLVLTNDIGAELRARVPRAGGPPMRLSIEFGDEAPEELKGLPWEFLFDPERKWFLATKTELLLTRYVSREEDPVDIEQIGADEKLRVLLIAALPGFEGPGEDPFAAPKLALWKLRRALTDLKHLDVPDPIEVWDRRHIEAALKKKPCHILHVVGICRGAPGPPKIYLGDGGDGFQDPGQFVESLTVEGAARPRLVILQLCDYVDGDATENFERLAPDLIRRNVPAVLALQYVARVDQVDHVGLGKQFYQHLVEGMPIGAAVQASRRQLVSERPGHRFGTPVLYLQEDGALRRPLPMSGEGSSMSQPTGAAPRARTIRSLLMDVVNEQTTRFQLTDEQVEPLLVWVSGLNQDIQLADARTQVKTRLNAPLDPISQEIYIEMFRKLGKLATQTGLDDDRS